MHKHQRDVSAFSAATGETCLTGGKRASVTQEKRIPKKNKYIKSLAFSPLRKYPIPNQDRKIMGLNKYQCLTLDIPPFIPGNKILLNEDNDNNHETTDTSQSEKYDMSHTYRDDYIAKVKYTKNTNDDDKYKGGNSKHQDGNERVDNPETPDNLRDESVIKKTKEYEAFIKRLKTVNFKHHGMQYVINIVTFSGG